MKSYQEVQRAYLEAQPFQTAIALDSQPTYGIIAAIFGLIFITLALTSTSKAAGLPLVAQFLKYTSFSLVGSIFIGIATVFLTNSFGVYV